MSFSMRSTAASPPGFFRMSRSFPEALGLVSVLTILVIFAISAKSENIWNTGKCLQYDQQTFTIGETPHTTYSIEIQSDTRIYFVERTLNWRWQKFPHVTENGPISWHFKGKHEMLIRDDDGKIFAVDIVKTRIVTDH